MNQAHFNKIHEYKSSYGSLSVFGSELLWDGDQPKGSAYLPHSEKTKAVLRYDVMNIFSILTTYETIGDIHYKDIYWKGFSMGSKLEL